MPTIFRILWIILNGTSLKVIVLENMTFIKTNITFTIDQRYHVSLKIWEISRFRSLRILLPANYRNKLLVIYFHPAIFKI